MNKYKEACHCCGGQTYESFKGKSKIYQCPRCRHIFRDYSHIDLDKFYNEEYRKRHKLYPRATREKFANNIVDLVSPYITDCKTILEIGSGDGVLTEMFKDSGKTVIASEINKNLQQHLTNNGYTTFGNFMEIPDTEKFDCSISTDVLEHIEHPSTYVEKMKNIITKKVIIQVPILRVIEYQSDIKWDGHFHYFSEHSIKALFEKYFDIEFIYNEKSYMKFAWNSEMIVVLKKKDKL